MAAAPFVPSALAIPKVKEGARFQDALGGTMEQAKKTLFWLNVVTVAGATAALVLTLHGQLSRGTGPIGGDAAGLAMPIGLLFMGLAGFASRRTVLSKVLFAASALFLAVVYVSWFLRVFHR